MTSSDLTCGEPPRWALGVKHFFDTFVGCIIKQPA